jgi:hypothetical protein
MRQYKIYSPPRKKSRTDITKAGGCVERLPLFRSPFLPPSLAGEGILSLNLMFFYLAL